MGVLGILVKEAKEEASLPADLVRHQAVGTGAVSYFYVSAAHTHRRFAPSNRGRRPNDGLRQTSMCRIPTPYARRHMLPFSRILFRSTSPYTRIIPSFKYACVCRFMDISRNSGYAT